MRHVGVHIISCQSGIKYVAEFDGKILGSFKTYDEAVKVRQNAEMIKKNKER